MMLSADRLRQLSSNGRHVALSAKDDRIDGSVLPPSNASGMPEPAGLLQAR